MGRFLEIIVPQYNEDEALIDELLKSIEKQKGIDFEDICVTLVNDNSNRIPSEDLLKKYEKLNIKLLTNARNVGPGLTRQHGIDESEAKYITFIDADDELYDDKGLYIAISCLKETDKDILLMNFVTKEENQTVVMNGQYYSQFLHGKVIKREFLLKNGIRFSDNIKMFEEDKYFTSCIFYSLNTDDAVALRVPFYFWKVRDNSITRNKNPHITYAHDIFNCITGLYDFYKKNPKDNFPSEFIVDSLYGYYQILESEEFTNLELKEKYLAELKEYILSIKNVYDEFDEDKKIGFYENQLKAVSFLTVNVKYEDFIKFIKS